MKQMNFFRQAYLVITHKYDDPTPVQTKEDAPVSGTKGSTCPTCQMPWQTWTDEDGQLYRICPQGHKEYFGDSY